MVSGRGHEEHSGDGKSEQSHTEDRGGKPHTRLLKLPRRPGKKEHGGKEHSVGEILAGTIARFARLGDPRGCISPGCGRFLRAANLIKVRHKWVRISGAILERLLPEPCFIGLLHVGRKTFGIKARELFVPVVLRGDDGSGGLVIATESCGPRALQRLQGLAQEAPVLVTSAGIRPFVRGIIERFRAQTPVMSQSEVHPRARLKTVGSI